MNFLDITSNAESLYDGNLKYYLKLVFHAPNAQVPYHNFRHMVHVTCEVYDAIKYYGDFEKDRARALLIAALFHDYGHKGVIGNDYENIKKAQQAIRHFILDTDKSLLPEIEGLISITEYPHANCAPSRSAQILRDADMSQLFSEVWLQQVVYGFAKEHQISAVEFLERQLEFIPKFQFYTDWARNKFSQKKAERLLQVKQLLEIVKN